MKTLKFQTIAHKNYEVKFSEDDFFDHMKRCGVVNIPIENQIGVYINNLHETLLNTGMPYDSVMPQTIDYKITKTFRKKYSDINDILKYGL